LNRTAFLHYWVLNLLWHLCRATPA